MEQTVPAPLALAPPGVQPLPALAPPPPVSVGLQPGAPAPLLLALAPPVRGALGQSGARAPGACPPPLDLAAVRPVRLRVFSDKKLGSGTYGTVYEGEYYGLAGAEGPGHCQPCAVKVFDGSDAKDHAEAEARNLRHLWAAGDLAGKLPQHWPHVVRPLHFAGDSCLVPRAEVGGLEGAAFAFFLPLALAAGGSLDKALANPAGGAGGECDPRFPPELKAAMRGCSEFMQHKDLLPALTEAPADAVGEREGGGLSFSAFKERLKGVNGFSWTASTNYGPLLEKNVPTPVLTAAFDSSRQQQAAVLDPKVFLRHFADATPDELGTIAAKLRVLAEAVCDPGSLGRFGGGAWAEKCWAALARAGRKSPVGAPEPPGGFALYSRPAVDAFEAGRKSPVSAPEPPGGFALYSRPAVYALNGLFNEAPSNKERLTEVEALLLARHAALRGPDGALTTDSEKGFLLDGARILAFLTPALPLEALADAMLQLARGLKHCHDKNVYHYDIKPAQVLLSRVFPGNPFAGIYVFPRLELCDFSSSSEFFSVLYNPDFGSPKYTASPSLPELEVALHRKGANAKCVWCNKENVYQRCAQPCCAGCKDMVYCPECMKENVYQRCAGCKDMAYCSKTCQENHWDMHYMCVDGGVFSPPRPPIAPSLTPPPPPPFPSPSLFSPLFLQPVRQVLLTLGR
jgi:hypothetical protein